MLLALVVFILPPTGADTVLALELLALCGGGFLVVVVVVVVVYVAVVVVAMGWRWWLNALVLVKENIS